MQVFAGIDEAGYGPKFGPLTAGCCVLGIADEAKAVDVVGGEWPDFWAMLEAVVGRKARDAGKRIAVSDSKKLTVSGKHGHGAVPHLERAVLAFSGLGVFAEDRPSTASGLLSAMGSEHHRRADLPVWYGKGGEDWDALPVAGAEHAGRLALDAEGLAVDRGWLEREAASAGVVAMGNEVEAGGVLRVAVACEDAFNRRLAQARSKADVSFALIAHHLRGVWERHGNLHPGVVIDRQGGRTHYAAALSRAMGGTVGGASVRIVEETAGASVYELRGGGGRAMTVRFQPKADDEHFCVALASMAAKYAREVYMHRFQRWWSEMLPEVKSTAGYGTDANRFLAEVLPSLDGLGVARESLVRRA